MIHVALSADKAYTVPLALCLHSMVQTAAPGTEYHFHILDSGVDRALVERGHFKHLTWYNVEEELRELPQSPRYPTSIYHRYLLPRIIPAEIGRIFYLDCDTQVLEDLSDLFHSDLKGHPMAAAPWEVLGYYREEYGQYIRNFPSRFELPDDGTPYFYSSQLLMDLNAMRAMNATAGLIELTEKYTRALIWPDQDVLNAYFRGNILSLPLRYNVIPLFANQLENESAEAEEAFAHPAIIHFAATKPNILTGPRNEMETAFFLLWQQSPWKREIPYPLISLAYMPRPVARLLNTVFKALIPFPSLLHLLGKGLAAIRKLTRKEA